MKIARDRYLKKFIAKKENGLIKVITGIRRCGKSYLLSVIYKEWLLETGVAGNHIIELALDDLAGARYRNPMELDAYIRGKIADDGMYYVFLDEIQNVAEIQNPYVDNVSAKLGFVDVLLGLMKIRNVDLYVTGSNSTMLSSDILTQFRGRADEIRVHPLSYDEFYAAYPGEQRHAWREYVTYGGMPYLLSLPSHEEKSKYLKDLFRKVYLADIVERNSLRNDETVLDDLLNMISSAVGSLTNPTRLANSFGSVKQTAISANTISRYLGYFEDAFLIDEASRFDIKGKKYMSTPLKYYFTDVGLRNARLNFRQQEENHIMENIIFNELHVRDFDVDIGVVPYSHMDGSGKKIRSQLEVDFVANKGSHRYYIQSALQMSDEEKRQQEKNPLMRIDDSFKKIVIVRDTILPWYDEDGIFYVGVEDFLLDEKVWI